MNSLRKWKQEPPLPGGRFGVAVSVLGAEATRVLANFPTVSGAVDFAERWSSRVRKEPHLGAVLRGLTLEICVADLAYNAQGPIVWYMQVNAEVINDLVATNAADTAERTRLRAIRESAVATIA
jgi:hypothetical protein